MLFVIYNRGESLRNDIKHSSEFLHSRDEGTGVVRYCVHPVFDEGFLGAGDLSALPHSACDEMAEWP